MDFPRGCSPDVPCSLNVPRKESLGSFEAIDKAITGKWVKFTGWLTYDYTFADANVRFGLSKFSGLHCLGTSRPQHRGGDEP